MNYCATSAQQRQMALIKQIGESLSERFWLPVRLFDIEFLEAQPSLTRRRSIVDDECETPPPLACYSAPSPTTKASLPPTTQGPPLLISFASTVTSTTHVATSTNSNLPPVAPWNTLPISDKMKSCYNSDACQNPKKLYDYCKDQAPDRGNEVALQKCFCKDLATGNRTWQTTVVDCLTCIAKALPVENGKILGAPQPANILVQNAKSAMNTYCTSNSLTVLNNHLLGQIGKTLTANWWLPISMFDVSILEDPISLASERSVEVASGLAKQNGGAMQCADNYFCHEANSVWNTCLSLPSDTHPCLCTNNWYDLIQSCGQCLDMYLPSHSSHHPDPLSISIPRVAKNICNTTTDDLFLPRLVQAGKEVTADYESKIYVFSMALIEDPHNPPNIKHQEDNVKDCDKNIWCNWANKYWNDCTKTGDRAKNCLCSHYGKEWFIALDGCARCLDTHLKPNNGGWGSLVGTAMSKGWVKSTAHHACNEVDNHNFLPQLMEGGVIITKELKSQMLVFNMTLLPDPPATPHRQVDVGDDVNTKQLEGDDFSEMAPPKERHVVEARQTLPKSWMGELTSEQMKCYHSDDCTKARNIWAKCLSCPNPHDNWVCLCINPSGTNSLENPSRHGIGGGLAGDWAKSSAACYKCLEPTLPETNLDIPFQGTNILITTYCYTAWNTTWAPAPTNRLIDSAEDGTARSGSPLSIFNFTVQETAPRLIQQGSRPAGWAAYDDVGRGAPICEPSWDGCLLDRVLSA
ncbi:hypothetical protein BGZ60DRAFT_416749 [Tricladium varicosporioides]|nr:hypothetical protein BGZ60DRAFT_416749 [Hymenoscyphus varicosporioides]